MAQATSRLAHAKSPADSLRSRIHAAVEKRGMSLATLSRSLGQSADWLRSFLYDGVPEALPDDVAVRLSDILGIHIPRAARPVAIEEADTAAPIIVENKPPKRVDRAGHPSRQSHTSTAVQALHLSKNPPVGEGTATGALCMVGLTGLVSIADRKQAEP